MIGLLENPLLWVVLALSPVLAAYLAMGIHNAICISRRKEQLAARDEGYDDVYRSWRERMRARSGLEDVFCPLPLANGETCYHYAYQSALHVLVGRQVPVDEDAGPVFDTDSGVSVGCGWSLLDHFGVAGSFGKASFCVTDRHVRLKGIYADLQIPLEDIRAVAASCSNVMIDAALLENPLLIDDVNGQMVRDILHRLMDEQGLLHGFDGQT